jgi:hypothetical protein
LAAARRAVGRTISLHLCQRVSREKYCQEH